MTRWQVSFLCCGRESFSQVYDTWEQADQHRRWWEASEDFPHNGHMDRRGIITEQVPQEA